MVRARGTLALVRHAHLPWVPHPADKRHAAAGGASGILGHLSDITAITNSNAGVITLTAAQVLATHVNDGAGSALSKVTGG